MNGRGRAEPAVAADWAGITAIRGMPSSEPVPLPNSASAAEGNVVKDRLRDYGADIRYGGDLFRMGDL